jgi:quercetin dioxygenase-like cupin family protein
MDRVTEAQRKSEEVTDGVHLADLAAGERMSMKRWRVESGETLPAHRHHNEQIGYVISGSLTAVIEGEEHTLEPGDSYVFPSDEHHGAENRDDEPAIGIGVLSPPRDEPRWGRSRTSKPAETDTPAETDD